MTSRKHLAIEVELGIRNEQPINKPWRINIWWVINWYVGSYSGLPAWSLTVSGSSPFLLLHIPANLDNDNATLSGWITSRQTRQHAIAFRVPCSVLLQGFTTERFKTLKQRPVVVYRLGNNGKRNSTVQSQIDHPTNHFLSFNKMAPLIEATPTNRFARSRSQVHY